MKVFKYILLVLAIFAIIAFVYYFSKDKKPESSSVYSPMTEIVSEKTSFFSLENAPKESIKGEITSMSGDISWQSRTATEASKLSSFSEVLQGEKYITGEDSNLSLSFENVCLIDLSSETEVEIIQTLPSSIVFSQTSGVGKYTKKGSNTISIRVLKLLVEIDGEILISIDSEDPIITLEVNSGSAIAAYNDLEYLSHEVSVYNGKTFTFNYDKRKGVLE
jgi:hypothetical protein